MNFIDFFKQHYLQAMKPNVKVSFRDGKDGYDNGIGNLFGVDLDSDNYSGYIYFWDKGFLDYGLINLQTMEDEISSILIPVKNFDDKVEVIEKIIGYFTL